VTSRAYSAALILLTVAILTLGGILLAGIFFPENRIVTPHIDPINISQPPVLSTISYPYEKKS
jgi:hypothetical protein